MRRWNQIGPIENLQSSFCSVLYSILEECGEVGLSLVAQWPLIFCQSSSHLIGSDYPVDNNGKHFSGALNTSGRLIYSPDGLSTLIHFSSPPPFYLLIDTVLLFYDTRNWQNSSKGKYSMLLFLMVFESEEKPLELYQVSLHKLLYIPNTSQGI